MLDRSSQSKVGSALSLGGTGSAASAAIDATTAALNSALVNLQDSMSDLDIACARRGGEHD